MGVTHMNRGIEKPVKPNIVTFNLSALDGIEDNAGAFIFKPEAESFLLRWTEFKEVYEALNKSIKEKLKLVMDENKTKKVTGEGISVTKQPAGNQPKYEIVDQTIALDLGFATEETKVKIDSDAIDRYVKDTQELPEGIKIRERNETVVIRPVK